MSSPPDRRVPRILTPLAIRDFRLLWAGMTVSFLGDGVYLVAVAWQVYELENAPTALSLVGLAQSIPLVVFVLLGGVLSDRLDRRRLMLAADAVRGIAIGTMAVLSLAGALELWHIVVLSAVVGFGQALFWPAFGAIVPDIVPQPLLVQANSLSQLVRPLALTLAGPALGGVMVASLGAGEAFLADAGSFIFSFAMLLLMRSPARVREDVGSSMLADVRAGFRFVRAHTWLWGTLLMAAVTLLLVWGPYEVLVPYIVKNELGGSARDLGLVFAAGGLGAVLVALVTGQRGLPRLHITYMYVAWAVGNFALAGIALATTTWQAALAMFVGQGLFPAGMIVWVTLMQRLVPAELLGRVKSVDWLVSVSLVPVSFAVTGPVAEALGAVPTMLGACTLGGVLTIAFLFIPGMRDTEREGSPTHVVLGADEAEAPGGVGETFAVPGPVKAPDEGGM